MKPLYQLFALLFLCSISLHSQTENMNFEFGNFDNWILDTGMRRGQTPDIIDWNPRPAADINEQIELTTPASPQFDPVGLDCAPTPVNIESIFPGGAFSARLGNLDGGRRTARISRTFTVTPQETILQYSYAVVLDDPEHDLEEQPKFVVNIKDNAGDIVTCGKFEAFAGENATANGFTNCDAGTGSVQASNLQILPWTTAAADLTPFIGQQITIEFISLDCSRGAHGGYAYVEANINELEIDVVGLCNAGPNDITLTAPLGFDSYLWSTGDTTRTISVQGTQFGDSYTVDLISNTGCNTSASITLGPVDSATINPLEDQDICEGATVILAPTGENVGDFLFPELNITGIVATATPTQDTTYTVIARDENGCEGESTTVTISVFESDLPPFPDANFELNPILTDTNAPCSTVQFNNLSAYCRNDLAYVWDFGDGTTSNEISPTHTFPDPVDGVAVEYFITLTATSTGDGSSDTFSLSYRNSVIEASFSTLQRSECAPLTITNNSNICDASSITDFPQFEYTWNFGDGQPEITTDHTTERFEYTYATSGTYIITLTISNPSNPSFTATPFTEEVEINIDTTANFDFDINCFEVQFNNLSIACESGITYSWDFGDASPLSNEVNPLHRYASEGPHNVILTLNDGTTDFTAQAEVLLTPNATIPDFDFEVNCDEVTFLDRTNSCQNLNYTWDFGDGSPFGIFPSPNHLYENEGSYIVTLTVNDGPMEFEVSKTVLVANEFDYLLPENLIECVANTELNPNSATFNLVEQTNLILTNVNVTGERLPSVSYHLSELDALSNLRRQNQLFENTVNPQNLFVRLEDNNGCLEVFPFTVTVINPPTITAIEDISLCISEINTTNYNLRQLDEQFFFDFNALNESEITYYISDTNARQKTASIDTIDLQLGVETTIYVRAEKKDALISCFEISSFNIRLDDQNTSINGRCTPFYANTLTPNGDGSNDYFYIKNIEAFPNNEITIYNRWGNIVYQTKGYDNKWDGTHRGKELPVGNYYYIINLNDSDNTSNTGYITILR